MPKHFWVNQGQSFGEARLAGCLWAPERDAEGATLNHWETMRDLSPGDVVFTYSDSQLRGYALVRSEAVSSQRPYRSSSPYQPGQGGRLVACEFRDIPKGPVRIETILANAVLLDELRNGQNAVLTSKNKVAQKYLCPLSDRAAAELRMLSGMPMAVDEPAKLKRLKPTQVLALVNARVGQGQFREDLLTSFSGACAVTGLSVEKLIRASHIRPWCECESDEQKLDPQNGLLLAAGVDAAFDCGLISFSDDGSILVSNALAVEDLPRLGITATCRLHANHLTPERRAYLNYHRDFVFEKRGKKRKKADSVINSLG